MSSTPEKRVTGVTVSWITPWHRASDRHADTCRDCGLWWL